MTYYIISIKQSNSYSQGLKIKGGKKEKWLHNHQLGGDMNQVCKRPLNRRRKK